MNRGNAGVIGTLVTPSSTVATGVFSLNQLQVAVKAAAWPFLGDPFFNYVTLLLPGNGTNGAQNNTFLDSSTNNFTITRNGNTTQGTLSPYGNNWSNYFDGTGDSLTFTGAAGPEGTQDFTVEMYVYITTMGGNFPRLFESSTTGALQLYLASGVLTYGQFGSPEILSFNISSLTNQWVHICVTRSGSAVRIFINGVLRAYTASGGTNFAASTSWKTSNEGGGIVGYMSNLRVVRGSVVAAYSTSVTTTGTTVFTPPTTPLTAIANTSLLTCQSNRFIDASTNNFPITRGGDVSVQRFSPFNPTAPYAAGTDGGSGYFDGTGDSVRVTSTASAFDITGDFTVECWCYATSASVIADIFGVEENTTGFAAVQAQLNTNRTVALNVSTTGSAWAIASNSTATVALNTWTHVAVVRSGSSVVLYLNGVSAVTGTVGGSLYNAGAFTIVGGRNAAGYFTGYISNFRFVNGTAVYTTAFTPPTAPVAAITNTSLLLDFTNAGIIDNAEMNNLETVGNAQISTAQSKFGGGSMLFDGNGDGLFVPPSQNPNFGSGNFTIELWIYYNSLTGAQTIISNGYTTPVTNGWLVQTGTGDGKFNFYKQTSPTTVVLVVADGGSAMSAGVWYHMAIVRNGTTTTIYRNGTSVGSATDTTTYTATAANFYVGGGTSTGFNGGFFNGYIDDLRITRGVARYTANFTPPITPFPTA
jgi:hypothetical protein